MVLQFGLLKDCNFFETWYTVEFLKPFPNKAISASVVPSQRYGSDLNAGKGQRWEGFINGDIGETLIKPYSLTNNSMQVGTDPGVYGNHTWGDYYWIAVGY